MPIFEVTKPMAIELKTFSKTQSQLQNTFESDLNIINAV